MRKAPLTLVLVLVGCSAPPPPPTAVRSAQPGQESSGKSDIEKAFTEVDQSPPPPEPR